MLRSLQCQPQPVTLESFFTGQEKLVLSICPVIPQDSLKTYFLCLRKPPKNQKKGEGWRELWTLRCLEFSGASYIINNAVQFAELILQHESKFGKIVVWNIMQQCVHKRTLKCYQHKGSIYSICCSTSFENIDATGLDVNNELNGYSTSYVIRVAYDSVTSNWIGCQLFKCHLYIQHCFICENMYGWHQRASTREPPLQGPGGRALQEMHSTFSGERDSHLPG